MDSSIQISKQQNIFNFLPTNFLCAMIVIILADRINELIQLKGFEHYLWLNGKYINKNCITL